MLRLITLSWCYGSEPANLPLFSILLPRLVTISGVHRLIPSFSNGQMPVDPPPLTRRGTSLPCCINSQWFQPAHEKNFRLQAVQLGLGGIQPLHSRTCSFSCVFPDLAFSVGQKCLLHLQIKSMLHISLTPVPPSHQPSALPFDCFLDLLPMSIIVLLFVLSCSSEASFVGSCGIR